MGSALTGSRLAAALALCSGLAGLFVACATTTETRRHTPESPELPELPEPPASEPADAPEDRCEPLPPPAEPLGPLREFTEEEWKRIRRAQRYVHHAARKRELSPSLINGMIWVESKFKPRARGKRGPRGILQLMPRTGRAMARRLGRRYMPYSIDFNITAGAEYLVVMLQRFEDDLELALAAYNAGPAIVVEWTQAVCPMPKPRERYVTHVQRAALTFCERLPRRYEPRTSAFTCPSPDDENDAPLVAAGRAAEVVRAGGAAGAAK